MNAPRLPALEKNVLKYRALQMVLLLQEFESLKRYVVASFRATDNLISSGSPRLPPRCKKPFETALEILVAENILEPEEKIQLLEYRGLRNRIGHELYKLVADVSDLDRSFRAPCLHDYWANDRLENLRIKISKGIGEKFINALSFEPLIFEQAELTYKEELARLEHKIQRQIAARIARPLPNNSFNSNPLRGST